MMHAGPPPQWGWSQPMYQTSQRAKASTDHSMALINQRNSIIAQFLTRCEDIFANEPDPNESFRILHGLFPNAITADDLVSHGSLSLSSSGEDSMVRCAGFSRRYRRQCCNKAQPDSRFCSTHAKYYRHL